ncbi:MAG: response regulator [Desulfobacterales bacterium]|jgi:twitching motility two-component system response regulator PilH|nr:response regulator [Desulfobacterales bacterium]
MQHRMKVLIVDDEPDMRTYLCNLLGGCGYDTIDAPNRQDGLRKAKAEKPALIILDVTMPREEGIQLYRELKQSPKLRKIPVIMVSSIAQKTFRQYQKTYCTQPSEEGTGPPGAYLKKPLNADELIGWVQALTAGSSA